MVHPNLGLSDYRTAFELLFHQVHRGNLRLCQCIDVAGVSDRNAAGAKNRLKFSSGNSQGMKARSGSAAECVLLAPHAQSLVLLEPIALGLVLYAWELADSALFDCRLKHALPQIVQTDRLARPAFPSTAKRGAWGHRAGARR